MDLKRVSRTLDAVAAFIDAAHRAMAPRAGNRLADELARNSDSGTLGPIEARLAGVLVAALREAFDRDSTRLELERRQIEVERQRADLALRTERLRQAAEREVGQLRGAAVLVMVGWATSAVFVVLRGAGAELGRAAIALLGTGWFVLFAGLATSIAGYQHVSAALAEADTRPEQPVGNLHGGAAAATLWLVTAGLTLTAAGLLASLL